MHELSLACSVVELVEKELALHGGGSVRCIEITIGDLSGVDNDAFLFSSCPKCGSYKTRLVSGQEFRLTSLIVETDK